MPHQPAKQPQPLANLSTYIPQPIFKALKQYTKDHGLKMAFVVAEAVQEHLVRKGAKAA